MKQLMVKDVVKIWKKLYNLDIITYHDLSGALNDVLGIYYPPGLYDYPEWLKEDSKDRRRKKIDGTI